jgi:copper homeostasis protein (lipoprotein)
VKVRVASGAPATGEAILLGVYNGMLPCADCSGLDTELRLYAKGKFDFTYAFYVRTQTYRAAPHGDMTFSDRGDWALLRGDAVNPDATVYQLDPDDSARSQAYLVAENGAALVQLDREMKPIETKMNLTLRKAQ